MTRITRVRKSRRGLRGSRRADLSCRCITSDDIAITGSLINHSRILGSASKVEQESDLEPAGLEIVKKLHLVEWLNLRGGLDLDDHTWIDDQIGPECRQKMTAEPDWKAHLLANRLTGLLKGHFEGATEHVFRES